MDGATNDEGPAGVVVVEGYPEGLSDTPTPTWTVKAMEIQAVDANWRLSARVVCADAAD